MKKVALLSFAALAFSGFANASLIPSLVSGVGGVYTYNVALDANEQLNNTVALQGSTCSSSTAANVPCGQFLTLFDLTGVTSASAPAGFTTSIQLIGFKNNLTGLALPDSSTVNNVTFMYNGPTIAGPQMFNGFVVNAPNTVLSQTANVAFAFNTAHNPDTGFADQGAGVVQGPMSAAVPEPGSMLLLGGGLVGLGLLRRKLFRS